MIDLFIIQGGIIGSMTGNCRFYNVSGTSFSFLYPYLPLATLISCPLVNFMIIYALQIFKLSLLDAW